MRFFPALSILGLLPLIAAPLSASQVAVFPQVVCEEQAAVVSLSSVKGTPYSQHSTLIVENGTGDIIAVHPDGSLDALLLFHQGSPSRTITVTTGATVETGSIDVSGTSSGQISLFAPVFQDGDTHITNDLNTQVIGQVSSAAPGLEIRMFLQGLIQEIPLQVNPQGNHTDFATNVTNRVGLGTYIVTVRDLTDPQWVPSSFTFHIDFQPASLSLSRPIYLSGEAEAFQSPARFRSRERFGDVPEASTNCCGCPQVRHPFTAIDRNDGVNVNLCSGRFFQHFSLLTLPGKGIPIDLELTYNSHLLFPGGHVLGRASFSHSYVVSLFQGEQDEILRFDGGAARVDTFQANGPFWEADGYPALLRVNEDGTYTLRYASGVKEHYYGFTGSKLDGRLFLKEDANLTPNTIQILYENSPQGDTRVAQVVDSYGRPALTFQYDDGALAGKLVSVTDLTQREVCFAYTPEGDLERVRSPRGPDFPQGRVFRFECQWGFLFRVFYPNEAETKGAEARIEVDYAHTSLRLNELRLGGVNASGIPAGGGVRYEYLQRLGGERYTRVLDRRGNLTEYDWGQDGERVLVKTEFNGGLRENGPFVTSYTYTRDGFLASVTRPEGDSTLFIYDLEHSRFQIGNLLEVRLLAGPRGAEQAEITTRFSFELLFNQCSTKIDPRENDPLFVPPFGGGQTQGRYTTRSFYGYQEGGFPPSEDGWGIDPQDLDLNLGDLNGDGIIPSGCRVVVRRELPARTLPDGSSQERLALFQYNPFGQLTKSIDPGGVATSFTYFPEEDPADTGHVVVGRDPSTGGFLKEAVEDSDPGSIYGGALPIVTSQTWNRIGDIQSITNGRGIRSSFSTNEVHLVTTAVRADDTSLQASQRHEAIPIPPLSIVVTNTYDANDNVIEVAHDNRDNESSHGGGFILRRYEHDILDQVRLVSSQVTEGTWIQELTDYDENENPISVTKSHATDYVDVTSVYDSRDLLYSRTHGEGAESSTIVHLINANGASLGIEDALDNVPGAGLDGDGLPERTTIVRDGYERVTEYVDRLGNRTEIGYDPASNRTHRHFYGHPANDPLGAPTLMSEIHFWPDEADDVAFIKRRLFVDSGQVLHATPSLDTDDPSDSQFVTSTFHFDPNGLLTQELVPNRALGPQTTVSHFDGHRRLIRRIDALGNEVEWTYDNKHNEVVRTEREVQPDGLSPDESFTFETLYDAIDRKTRDKDPQGHTTRYTWGTLFLTSITDAEGPSLIPDPAGGGLINDEGNRRVFRHDGLGRQIEVHEELTTSAKGGGPPDVHADNPDGRNSVSWIFDDVNRRVDQIDDRSNVTSTTRDTRGNIVRVDWADGTSTQTVFDLEDDPIQIMDQNGNTIDQTFDALGRLVRRDVSRGPGVEGTTYQEVHYDGASRVTSSIDDGGNGHHDFQSILECAWDSLGNRIEERHNGLLVSRSFKSLRDPVRIVYPSRRKVSLHTDSLDRLEQIDDAGGGIQFDYIGTWRTLRTVQGRGGSGASQSDYVWDQSRRLIGVHHANPRNGKSWAEYTASYNREDFLTSQSRLHQGGQGEQVDRDSVYRVTGYRDGVASPHGPTAPGEILEESWVLDGVGNWRTYSRNDNGEGANVIEPDVDVMNAYLTFGQAVLSHDANGNRETDDRYRYVWDFANRLREVRDRATEALIAIYSYHVDGRRARKVVVSPRGMEETLFAWDGESMIAEYGPRGSTAETLFGRESEIIKRIGSSRPAGGAQSLLERPVREVFFHLDCKGWVAALTDTRGDLVETYRYTAYGDVTMLDPQGERRTESEIENPWLYHGSYKDRESGLYYSVHRYLDPQTGRWLSRDPMGYADGMGLYEFVKSTPVGRIDPLGLECTDEEWEELKKAITRLGARRYADREAASKLLRAAGVEAKELIVEGLKSKDLEIRNRCRALLDQVKVLEFEQSLCWILSTQKSLPEIKKKDPKKAYMLSLGINNTLMMLETKLKFMKEHLGQVTCKKTKEKIQTALSWYDFLSGKTKKAPTALLPCQKKKKVEKKKQEKGEKSKED